MIPFPDDAPEVQIQQIVFNDDGMWQFFYVERRDVTEDALVAKTLVVNSKKLPAQDVIDFMDDARSLIDEGLVVLRRPDDAD